MNAPNIVEIVVFLFQKKAEETDVSASYKLQSSS